MHLYQQVFKPVDSFIKIPFRKYFFGRVEIFPLLLSLLLSHIPELTAQFVEKGNPTLLEIMEIKTDRMLYLPGEKCMVKLICYDDSSSGKSKISKYAYLELLTVDNQIIEQQIIRLENGLGSTFCAIPLNIPTTSLILRSYTRLMRNYGPDEFAYKKIDVFNPEIFNIKDTLSLRTSEPLSLEYDTCVKIEINGFPESIIPRQKIHFEIKISHISQDIAQAECLISIVKKGTENEALNISKSLSASNFTTVPFEPERIGLILNGTIIPNPGKKELSIGMQGVSTIIANTTVSENGNYYMILPKSFFSEGKYFGFLQNVNSNTFQNIPEKQFDERFAENSDDVFMIHNYDWHLLENLMISAQVEQVFGSLIKIERTPELLSTVDFYGIPDASVKLSEFIKLPNMEEVFREIVKEVLVTRENNQLLLQVINKHSNRTIGNNPGIFINGIPVQKHSIVLDLQVQDIDRIQIVSSRYLLGSQIYDGLIDIKTKRKIPLENLHAFTFQIPLIAITPKYIFPDYSISNSSFPDFRNTLYWNPNVQSNKNGMVSVDFFTSDEQSDFVIIVDGKLSDGKCFFRKQTFSVRYPEIP